jgi:hypothetical protein
MRGRVPPEDLTFEGRRVAGDDLKCVAGIEMWFLVGSRYTRAVLMLCLGAKWYNCYGSCAQSP